MANEVDIALRSWCFGNTRYRSGDAETEQYVLRVTHRTMTIQRRTEEPSPGLLIVITSDNVSGVQVFIVSYSIEWVLTSDPRFPRTA